MNKPNGLPESGNHEHKTLYGASEDLVEKFSEPSSTRFLGWRSKKGPQESNKSGMRALGCNVLLLEDNVEEKTASGIVLPTNIINQNKKSAIVATVVEIGWDCWTDKTTDYCNVGDRILVSKNVGWFSEIESKDGRQYRLVSDLDILSVIS